MEKTEILKMETKIKKIKKSGNLTRKKNLLSDLKDKISQLFSGLKMTLKGRDKKAVIKSIDINYLQDRENLLCEYVRERGKDNPVIKKFELLIEGINHLNKFTDIFVSFSDKQNIIFEDYGVIFVLESGKKDKSFLEGKNKWQFDQSFGLLKAKRKRGNPSNSDVLSEFFNRIEKELEFELNAVRKRIEEISNINKEFSDVESYLSKF